MPLVLAEEDKNNPWLNKNVKTECEVDEFIESYRKYWDEKGEKEKRKADSESNSAKTSTNRKSENKLEKQIFDKPVKPDEHGKHLCGRVYLFLKFIFYYRKFIIC